MSLREPVVAKKRGESLPTRLLYRSFAAALQSLLEARAAGVGWARILGKAPSAVTRPDSQFRNPSTSCMS